jgi:uncharacterized protein (DUF1786 family)
MRFLAIDVGAGTMDLLFYDEEDGSQYKAVVKSPVRLLAERIESAEGDLLIDGCEMGGGPVTEVLRRRARECSVVMSRSSALTLNHDLEKVRSWGIRVVEDSEAQAVIEKGGGAFRRVSLMDVDPERIRSIVECFGVGLEFDVVGVCAQDHGVPPAGTSHLDYRHSLFKAALDNDPFAHSLVYGIHEIPHTLSRLRAIALSASLLPAREVMVMDSGMAAICGASTDSHARGKTRVVVVDVATSHTLAAALEQGRIAGLVEYHTRDLTRERLEEIIVALADGEVDHARVLEEGGHGAYMRTALGMDSVEIILATGPKRGLLEGSRLPIVWGAPLGDNMMTGAWGVIQAVLRNKGR